MARVGCSRSRHTSLDCGDEARRAGEASGIGTSLMIPARRDNLRLRLAGIEGRSNKGVEKVQAVKSTGSAKPSQENGPRPMSEENRQATRHSKFRSSSHLSHEALDSIFLSAIQMRALRPLIEYKNILSQHPENW